MRQIASGFGLAEAPVVSADGVLHVADVLRGGVRRLGLDGSEAGTLVPERRGIGGAGVGDDGRLVVTGRDVAAVDADGGLTTLLSRPAGVTGFNDLGISPTGDVLVGALRHRPMAGDPPVPAQLLLLAAGEDARVWHEDTITWPNGIAWSPAGDLVYVADFATGQILRSPWPAEVGRLEPWAVSPSGQADGMAVADDGDLFVALGSGGGVGRFAPSGDLREVIPVPAPFVASVCFWPGEPQLVITTAGAGPDDGGVHVADVGVGGVALSTASTRPGGA